MLEASLSDTTILMKIVEDLVADAPFDCTESAMYFQAMDLSRVALVSLKLDRRLFDSYKCDSSAYLGISLKSMFNALKFAGKNDSCVIKYVESEYDILSFRFTDSTKEKKQEVTIELMSIDAGLVGIPATDFSVVCEMSAIDFQQTCENLALFSDSVNINATETGISFTATGEMGQSVVRFCFSGDFLEDNKAVKITIKEPVDINFSVKYLKQFTKASFLSERVRISLCNAFPVTIEYPMDGKGYLRFYLAPSMDVDELEDQY